MVLASVFLRHCWERYQWNLVHRPYRINAATSCVIAIFGDLMAQTVFKDLSGQPRTTVSALAASEDSKEPLQLSSLQIVSPSTGSVMDLRRSLIFASFTVCFGTPFWLRMYKVIDRAIPRVTPFTAIQKGMLSWCAANMTTPFFIAYITMLDRWFIQAKRPQWTRRTSGGDEADDDALGIVFAKVRRDLPVLMSYSICFWSIQWIPMFYLLPPHFRLVYGSLLQIVWSGVTSFLLHRSDPSTLAGGVPT